MSMSIRFLLIRLVIGSNQPESTPKIEPRIVRTYAIYMETNSDSIAQTMPRAFIREILKD